MLNRASFRVCILGVSAECTFVGESLVGDVILVVVSCMDRRTRLFSFTCTFTGTHPPNESLPLESCFKSSRFKPRR